jgi:serpin B
MITALAFVCLLGAWPAAGRAQANNDPVTTVAAANNAFALDLYAKLRGRDGNIFVSPYSVSTALAMTMAGARGQTGAEMMATLHLPARKDIHALLAQLIWRYQADRAAKGYELHVADAMWVAVNGIHLNPDFVDTVRGDYAAAARPILFIQHETDAAKTINDWVAQHTGDKIKNLIPASALSDQTKLVLTNAIYFKGSWEAPFVARATREAPWRSPAGDITVPMMHRTGQYGFCQEGPVKMLSLPYAGGDLEMLAILPEQMDGIDAVEKSLDARRLDDLSAKLAIQDVEVSLPKFHMESQFDLSGPLKEMGMAAAFGPQADFSGIDFQHNLQITAVVHKAYIDVYEEGTEAAGATGVMVGAAAIRAEPPTFNADHPFLLLIRDVKEKTILFMGRVSRPQP